MGWLFVFIFTDLLMIPKHVFATHWVISIDISLEWVSMGMIIIGKVIGIYK